MENHDHDVVIRTLNACELDRVSGGTGKDTPATVAKYAAWLIDELYNDNPHPKKSTD